jgi:hypothetical protein
MYVYMYVKILPTFALRFPKSIVFVLSRELLGLREYSVGNRYRRCVEDAADCLP